MVHALLPILSCGKLCGWCLSRIRRTGRGMKQPNKVTNIFDRTNNTLFLLAGVLIIFVMLAVGAEVTMRFFFDRGTIWVQEISQYSLLFITFLGAAWVLKIERHVKIDLLLNRLNPKVQALLNMITSTLCTIACSIITWYGVRVAWDYFQAGYYFSTPLETPQFIVLGIIPIGSFLLVIQFLRRTYGFLEGWKTPPAEKQK